MTHDLAQPLSLALDSVLAAAAIQATGAGMSVADATLPDTPLVFVNQAFCTMTGYRAEELLGCNARLLQGPETDPATVAQIAAALAAHQSISVEILNYRRDGSAFWNRLTIDPVRQPRDSGPVRWYVAHSLDISERRRLEQALEDSERRLQVILDTAADAIITMDGDSRIRDFNAAAEQIFGYRRSEVIGGSLKPLLPPAEKGAHAGRVDRYLATGRARIIGTRREVQGIHRDGHAIDLELGVSEVLVGGETLFTGVLRDITDRKRAEAALRDAKAEAENAARAKADFLAAMSHEIRTPMNGVLGMAELLLDTPLSDEQRTYARAVVNAGTALLTVLNDILDVSKLEAGRVTLQPEPFLLSELVAEVLALLAPQARDKGLVLDSRIDPALSGELIGDPLRIRQILLNLAGNAVKFTDAGRVTVAATRDASPPSGGAGNQGNAPLREDGPVTVCLSVSDTGIGIPRDALDKLFTRFFQVDGSVARQFGGTGLGLTICQQLTQLMGGSIGVDSALGQGSRFEVRLPLAFALAEPEARPVAPAALQAATGASTPTRTAAHLLLVEDNPTNRLFAATLLRRAGYRVTLAFDGLEAVEAASEQDFDLVLMDIRMPEMDGYEATSRIRTLPGRRGRVPILALTAHAMADAQAECLARGMDGFIAKPLRRQELLGMVERLLTGDDAFGPGLDPASADSPEAAASSIRPTGAPASLDDATFDNLLDSIPKDSRERVLGAIMADLTGRLARLTTLSTSPCLDAKALAREVHDLSSVGGTIGAVTVMEQASRLERLCFDQADPQQLAAPLPALLRDLETALADLKRRTLT